MQYFRRTLLLIIETRDELVEWMGVFERSLIRQEKHAVTRNVSKHWERVLNASTHETRNQYGVGYGLKVLN